VNQTNRTTTQFAQVAQAAHPQQWRLPYTKLLYSPEEAAELLSISRSRLYILLARAVIVSIKEGRARLIPATALDDYVRRRLDEQADFVAVSRPLGLYYSSRKGA
jgi:excisionase family DNA binding protein